MSSEEETKKLEAEEIEKRVAPMTLYTTDPITELTESPANPPPSGKDGGSGAGGGGGRGDRPTK